MTNIKDFIVLDNDDFIIINKPPGLLSIPDREGKEISLKNILKNIYSNIFTVHRLDRDTSGLIIFAKNEQTHKYLSQQFEEREVEKIYIGLVTGSLNNKRNSINAAIMENPAKKGSMIVHKKGKESLTDYEVVDDFGLYSLVRFRIHTGRTHQIRVHMQFTGHPIACDALYGDGKPIFISSLKQKFKLSKSQEEEKPILNRVALHALQLKFKDMKGETIAAESVLPKDLKATIQQLEKRKKASVGFREKNI
jgi:23S rRNA pseudouridine955/2504/2580 synthase/23S rRNA pseudouridine1911/1915/1917 synthase